VYVKICFFIFGGFSENGFLFFAEFLGVTPPPAAAAYPPPPASTAGERPGSPPAVYAVRVYRNAHNAQSGNKIIMYILWL
jgi:hypothetical protein